MENIRALITARDYNDGYHIFRISFMIERTRLANWEIILAQTTYNTGIVQRLFYYFVENTLIKLANNLYRDGAPIPNNVRVLIELDEELRIVRLTTIFRVGGIRQFNSRSVTLESLLYDFDENMGYFSQDYIYNFSRLYLDEIYRNVSYRAWEVSAWESETSHASPIRYDEQLHHTEYTYTQYVPEPRIPRDIPPSPADIRAKELLLSHVSDSQRREFLENNSITVNGSNGGKYRIRPERQINIDNINPPFGRLCTVPINREIPIYDQMLSQIILLEENEDEFLKIANRW